METTQKKRITIEIVKSGNWYNFEGVPQEHRYIQVHNLRFTDDRKALCSAKKINPNFDYKIRQEDTGV